MIHGMVENRIDVLDEFKNNPNAHILLSSEVGSEGLDMQFCNSMVNYDLPWNPMVVEQRIGRIDREYLQHHCCRFHSGRHLYPTA